MKTINERRNAILTTNLASAIISLFVSLINKENPVKYKSFLLLLVNLSTLLMYNDSFRRCYRKQGVIKHMIKLIKDVLNHSQTSQES